MKVLILLVALLAVVAAKTCDCDFITRAVICKGLSLAEFHKKDSGCENAFWKIDLSENELEEFHNDLQQFRKVNLSGNSLEHLEATVNQKVQYLDVSRNNILQIDLENKFQSLQNLIANNNHLGLLDDFLNGQCHIVHLDVSENKIKTLKTVTKCSHLSILEASANKISQVNKELMLLTKLQVLDLSKNNLKEVSGLPSKLEMLNLAFNKIQRVSDFSFKNLALLQALDLTGNSISILEKDAFATLSSLQSLRLTGNNLKVLPSGLFKGLKSLRGIDINSNSIEYCRNDTFSDLSTLEVVMLETNKLSTLPALQFGRKVIKVLLGDNSITKMDHAALLTMFSGSRDERYISLLLTNFRGDDPEWSNVLKYFDGECSPELVSGTQRFLTNYSTAYYNKFFLASSSCACATFTKDKWSFVACITDGAEVDGLPWLEAAEIYAGMKEEDDGRHSKLKRDEF